MAIRINKLSGLGALLALAAASAASSQPTRESVPTNVDDRWIPSFSFSSGALMQYMNSSALSRCERGRPEEPVPIPGVNLFIDRLACTDPNIHDPNLPDDNPAFAMFGLDPPITPGLMDPFCTDMPSADGRSACLRPSDRDDELSVSPFVSASVEVMTPRVGLLPGAPRGFVGGEIVTLWAQERDIAREGNPATLAFPGDNTNAASTAGAALFGTGSTVESEVQRLAWSARGGLAFPFLFMERRIWLKPSFGWFRYEVDFDATVVAAVKPDPVDDPNAVTFAPGIREVTFAGSGSETFDGIGPGIEIEMEAGRFGPLGVSLFVNGQAYWVLGDRRFDFTDRVECPAFDINNPTGGCASSLLEDLDITDPNNPLTPVPGAHLFVDQDSNPNTPDALRAVQPDTYTAQFQFGVDPVAYRAGVGIRFHWLGR